jgi:membrane-bound ClpP family serine protease
MLNPSRTVVIALLLLAFMGLALGLATDVGLFGWIAAVLLLLYLVAVGVERVARG